MQARKALGTEAWDQVAAAIAPLGRGADNSFDLAKFVTDYNGLSKNGRHLRFTSTGKDSLKAELDALAAVGKAHKKLQALGNPSGTGRFMTVVATPAGTASAVAAGAMPTVLGTIGAAVGGHLLARAMAKPARVREMTRFAKAMLSTKDGVRGASPSVKFAALALARGLAPDGAGDENEIVERLLSL